MSLYATEFSILLTTSRLENSRQQLTDKLKAMANLPHGWSYGEGEPVTAAAIAVGKSYIAMASQLNLKADVFPNSDGGCTVTYYNGDELVEVSISPDGERLSLRGERGIGYDFENTLKPIECATARQVYDHILRLTENDIWRSFAHSIYASTDPKYGAFETWSIETHRRLWTERPLQTDAADFRFLKPLVPAHP